MNMKNCSLILFIPQVTLVALFLGSLVNGGDVHDSRMLDKLVTQVTDKVGKSNSVAVNAGYKTPHNPRNLAHYALPEKVRRIFLKK
jgi:hypothetical protein